MESKASRSLDNYGGYQIISLMAGYVMDGYRFEMTLEAVVEWLREYDGQEEGDSE